MTRGCFVSEDIKGHLWFKELQYFRPTTTLNFDNACKVLPKIFLATLLKCSQSFLLLAKNNIGNTSKVYSLMATPIYRYDHTSKMSYFYNWKNNTL